MTHDFEDDWICGGTESSFHEEEGKNYQKDDYEFREMIDISKIVGICIEDLYVPVK